MKLVSCNIRGQEQYYTVVMTYRDESRTGLKVNPLTVLFIILNWKIRFYVLDLEISIEAGSAILISTCQRRRLTWNQLHGNIAATTADVESTSINLRRFMDWEQVARLIKCHVFLSHWLVELETLSTSLQVEVCPRLLPFATNPAH